MKVKNFLLALLFAVTSLIYAEEPQARPASSRSQAQTEHRQFMAGMRKQEMDAMK